MCGRTTYRPFLAKKSGVFRLNNELNSSPDPFHMWGYTHISTLSILLIFFMTLFSSRHFLRPYRKVIYLVTGSLLLLSRLSLDAWYVATSNWSVQTSLPFELCSVASLLCALMLFTRNTFLFEVLFFIAISGSLQALLTPELAYSFPHFRYVQFFFDHFLLFTAPFLLIWFEGYSIRFHSLIKAFLFLNGLALIAFIINILIGANYMFLMDKPSTRSLLDFLGPHPFYLLSLEGVALVIFLALFGAYSVFRKRSSM